MRGNEIWLSKRSRLRLLMASLVAVTLHFDLLCGRHKYCIQNFASFDEFLEVTSHAQKDLHNEGRSTITPIVCGQATSNGARIST